MPLVTTIESTSVIQNLGDTPRHMSAPGIEPPRRVRSDAPRVFRSRIVVRLDTRPERGAHFRYPTAVAQAVEHAGTASRTRRAAGVVFRP